MGILEVYRKILCTALILLFTGIFSADTIKSESSTRRREERDVEFPTSGNLIGDKRTHIRIQEIPSTYKKLKAGKKGGQTNVVHVKTSTTRRPLVRPSFLPETCGVAQHNTMSRVLGGSVAEKGSWPWMGLLFLKQSFGELFPFCGAALVTHRHVVTAAHCLFHGRDRKMEIPPQRIIVRLGGFNKTDHDEPGAIDAEVAAATPHEEYDKNAKKNDIAVIKLKKSVTFTDNISPVCLPYDSLVGEDVTDKSVVLTGYGTTLYKGKSSDVLMQAVFTVQSQKVCTKSYRKIVKISDAYMCAGVMDGSKDSCQGDSGGPLVTVGKGNNYYLIGVVSFGLKCGTPNYPGVYTRVTEFLDWLARHLSE